MKYFHLIYLFLFISIHSYSQSEDICNPNVTFRTLFDMGHKMIKFNNDSVQYEDSIVTNNFNFNSFTITSGTGKNCFGECKFTLYKNQGKLVKIKWEIKQMSFFTNIYIKENECYYVYCLQVVLRSNSEKIYYPHFIINDKKDSTNLLVGFIPTAEFVQESCFLEDNTYTIDRDPFTLIGINDCLTPTYRISFIENRISSFAEIKKIDPGIITEFYGTPIPSRMERINQSQRGAHKIDGYQVNLIKGFLIDGIFPRENQIYVRYKLKNYLICFYYLNVLNTE